VALVPLATLSFLPMTLDKFNLSRLVIYSRNEMKQKDYYKQLEKQQRGTPGNHRLARMVFGLPGPSCFERRDNIGKSPA